MTPMDLTEALKLEEKIYQNLRRKMDEAAEAEARYWLDEVDEEMTLMDADIVWLDDNLEATFMAERLGDGFLLSIVFDDFPFDDVDRANYFLRHNDVGGTITVLGNIPVYHTLLLGSEEQLEEAARSLARRLKWHL